MLISHLSAMKNKGY